MSALQKLRDQIQLVLSDKNPASRLMQMGLSAETATLVAEGKGLKAARSVIPVLRPQVPKAD